ncbi:hypothetical protein [Brasilonema bromeliae]|uniref:hypothetical protein n=1 Tax=Brasilonema bromeliae TaxID=383615 RepID=UPI00145F19AA|nr:hypothetical protein [Brasilonema bromeliae]
MQKQPNQYKPCWHIGLILTDDEIARVDKLINLLLNEKPVAKSQELMTYDS